MTSLPQIISRLRRFKNRPSHPRVIGHKYDKSHWHCKCELTAKQLKKKYFSCLFLSSESSEWCQICGTSEGRQSLLDSEIITKARINIQGPCRGRVRYPAKLELLFFSFILIRWLHSCRFCAELGASACWGSPNTRNFLATLPHIPTACIAFNCDLCKARRMRTKVQQTYAPTSSLTGH